MPFTGEAGAAVVFLVAYLAVFAWLSYGVATRRIKLKSRWGLVYFHVSIRLASQACGIAFGIFGFRNTNVFLAYLILGAEGYFTLVLCAYRFLISWHRHYLPSRESWLEPRRDRSGNKFIRIALAVFLGPLALLIFERNLMNLMHFFLILANVLIVTGGSYLAGADFSDLSDLQRRLHLAKIMRTSGQSVFLAINAALIVAILVTIFQDHKLKRIDKEDKRNGVSPILIILLVTWIPLIIRGIFGVLQAAVWNLSYYNPDNYDSNGYTARFTAIEYVLGVLTEWSS